MVMGRYVRFCFIFRSARAYLDCGRAIVKREQLAVVLERLIYLNKIVDRALGKSSNVEQIQHYRASVPEDGFSLLKIL